MSNEDRNRGVAVDKQQHNQYGTFQGVANYPPPRPPRPHHHNPHPQQQQHQQQHHGPTIGFPPPASIAPPQYYPQAYQTVPGYDVAEGTPVRDKLPCCGIGFGWFLFIIGFFIGGLPWYIGFFVLLCARIDDREKAGYIACTIAVSIFSISIFFFSNFMKAILPALY
ncbi:hypothetical protein Godav_018762 [Gossypium davidsonii]|uniref:60S ribosomal protein L18a-like protein n=2 Tax=Gossypium TaxID=3633 RepID=A0A7J8QXI6_GOSDV|nr:hypothetical protein [Gossypium davidsonii]MBA0641231.1 hypothetical protein [Gossypium klotzschianum]